MTRNRIVDRIMVDSIRLKYRATEIVCVAQADTFIDRVAVSRVDIGMQYMYGVAIVIQGMERIDIYTGLGNLLTAEIELLEVAQINRCVLQV